MMSFDTLSAGYGGGDVLRSVNGELRGGDFIGLVGRNGCGKTTLIKTLIGQMTPTGGAAALGENSVHDLPIKDRAKQIAYLAQTREAAWGIRAQDLVTLGRAPHRGALGRLSQQDYDVVTEAMMRTQTQNLAGRRVSTLSGGEQARVHLARAIAVGAPLLIADEPIAALDPYYQITMMEQLKSLTQNGGGVIAALHDLALAARYCDRIWVMDEGRIIADAVPDIAMSAQILKTAFGITAPKDGFQTANLA